MAEKMTIRVGGRILQVDRFENGIPVVKATAEEVKRADGGQDVVVHVPTYSIGTEQHNPQ